MVRAELTYNPYLLETEVRFNGNPPRINSLVEKYQKEKLQTWVYDSPSIFYDEMNGYDFELKPAAGFGKDGYKNFDGCMTQLQMQTYLIIRKFERRRNRKGQSYGMAVSYYQKPEELWGYKNVTSAYAGQKNVLYIHARLGTSNWSNTTWEDFRTSSWFLDGCDDASDRSYCDIYAKIDPNSI